MPKKALNKQKIDEKGQLFLDALERAFSGVPQRSVDIMKKRYGVFDGAPKTLEEIGQEFRITRERVRQIIKEVAKKARVRKVDSVLDSAKKHLEFTLAERHGIIKESDILEAVGGDNLIVRNAACLLLECFEDFLSREENEKFEKVYHLADFDFNELERAIDAVKKLLEETEETLLAEALHEVALKNENLAIDRDKFFNYLKVSKEIKPNSFGKWGLSHWNEISPRVSWQRAYVILKEAGKPLHFTEIAALIDQHGLAQRKAHPQTIHNELIKNEKFVLVGRGIYALTEWGYKKGTVKDIIEDILKNSREPLEREEILAKILKMRQVKKSTILINLNNFFVKVDKDKYTVKG